MHIRTFRAANLQAALAEIRRQMGPSASVLHTRQVRDGWLGWLGRMQVEVTAGLSDQNESPASFMGGGTDVTAEPMGVRYAGTEAAEVNIDARLINRSQPPSVLSIDQGDELPTALAVYRSELTRLGVPFDIAKRWVDSTISFQAGLGDSSGPLTWTEPLQRSVARNIKISGPIRTQPGQRHVVALIGPTGVGKTTTIAKLAAGFRLESRRRVGLLTIDTFRIAAVQQLKAYAQIMDLPMEVVEGEAEMRPALDRLGDVDLILIDTAGRSPRSDARIEQLVRFLDAAQPDETQLVISATSSPDSILSTLEGFAAAAPTSAILTKLDETPHTAGMLAALERSEGGSGRRSFALPISYVTNGQQVPDDISVATADELTSRLLPMTLADSHMEAA